MNWPRRPSIYEINTWVWLTELGRRQNRLIGLGDVPAAEWDALAALGFDALWLMGVWERSPCSAFIAAEDAGLRAEIRRTLPDFVPEDLVGSPYAVHRYEVDRRLGGPGGLLAARDSLARRGIRLILDYVPNHLAVDHPWVFSHPDRFIRGTAEDLRRSSGRFFEAAGRVFAHGRDPVLPPWPDVAQLNAFAPDTRRASVETLRQIAAQCDGVRCDMAMLLLTGVFAQTWGASAGAPSKHDFWAEVIPAVRQQAPDFLFVAEVYWDLEWELMQQGFDFCYDKRFYDRLREGDAEGVRRHLLAEPVYQERLVRFTENHDEIPAAEAFPDGRQRAVALVAATLPGAKLFHEGQLDGWRVKVPLVLGRRPREPVDEELRSFYRTLLCELKGAAPREGDWRGCPTGGWPDNPTHRNLLAWCWRHGEERRLVVVNLSESPSQGLVPLPWDELADRTWRLTDAFTSDEFERNGDEMGSPGLYVALGPWGFHLLKVETL